MAAIDRTQQNAMYFINGNGHDVKRWERVSRFYRTTVCKRCGMKFEIHGYVSPYGISAKQSDNTDIPCPNPLPENRVKRYKF